VPKYESKSDDLDDDARSAKHAYAEWSAPRPDESDKERRAFDARLDFAAVAAVFPLKSRID
jgi:hypothetical protein